MGRCVGAMWRVGFGIFMFLGLAFGDTIDLPGSQLGSPLDLSEFESLGLSSDTFLFSQNTMYDYFGDYWLAIVSADVDPAQTNALTGSDTQVTDIDLGGAAAASDLTVSIPNVASFVPSGTTEAIEGSAPEPATVWYAVACLFCGLIYSLFRRPKRVTAPQPERAG